jgi:hypothetical protein
MVSKTLLLEPLALGATARSRLHAARAEVRIGAPERAGQRAERRAEQHGRKNGQRQRDAENGIDEATRPRARKPLHV